MKYQFNLEWDELPEDFKEQKIKEWIESGDSRDCEDCDGTGSITEKIPAHQEAGEVVDEQVKEWGCKTCDGEGKVDPDPDDLHQQEEAEEYIKAHFPIYF